MIILYYPVIRYFKGESQLACWHSTTEHISKVLIKIWHKSEMAIKNSPHVTFINNRARANLTLVGQGSLMKWTGPDWKYKVGGVPIISPNVLIVNINIPGPGGMGIRLCK
jgi:hypothetical protein